jgi:hypothetical protein
MSDFRQLINDIAKDKLTGEFVSVGEGQLDNCHVLEHEITFASGKKIFRDASDLERFHCDTDLLMAIKG